MSYHTDRFEIHLPVEKSGANAVDLLADACALSKQHLKRIMLKGAVWVSVGKRTQRLRRAKRLLKAGETLHLYYDKAVLEREMTPPELMADFGHYSVWNKPYGVLSQGSKWGDHCTVTRWAEQELKPQRNAFVVHRLDRAANGLIVIAHEKQAAAKLSALFQQRDIDKRYRIWVEGEFSAAATSDKPITVDLPIDGRHARSHFVFMQYDPVKQQSLLDVSIETGRKHQIRRHAASLGFPVIGDRLYGQRKTTENLQLSAYYLAFICPFTGQPRKFDLLAR
jgi:23S rRNA pseudouridine955/2504/2580 synthase